MSDEPSTRTSDEISDHSLKSSRSDLSYPDENSPKLKTSEVISEFTEDFAAVFLRTPKTGDMQDWRRYSRCNGTGDMDWVCNRSWVRSPVGKLKPEYSTQSHNKHPECEWILQQIAQQIRMG